MSSYIKDYEWEQYKDADDFENYYDLLEEQDKIKSRKRQTKLREYEGYVEDENGGD